MILARSCSAGFWRSSHWAQLGPVNASRAPESFLYRGKGLPDAREFSLSRKRPAEHQRVFFIEEKASRAPESFLYRGKGLPDAREFSLSRKRPARHQSPDPEGSFYRGKETLSGPERLRRSQAARFLCRLPM